MSLQGECVVHPAFQVERTDNSSYDAPLCKIGAEFYTRENYMYTKSHGPLRLNFICPGWIGYYSCNDWDF